MAFDRIYGPLGPCGCGEGTAMPYRLQDADFPIENAPFDSGTEIDCQKCDPGFQTWRPADRAAKLAERSRRKSSKE
jgi:hypothetical protein